MLTIIIITTLVPYSINSEGNICQCQFLPIISPRGTQVSYNNMRLLLTENTVITKRTGRTRERTSNDLIILLEALLVQKRKFLTIVNMEEYVNFSEIKYK